MTTTTNAPKRGWVKNAAIVFLAVLLALTFFSNTIMNISLPEVATGTVQSGTITETIRGSGTVTATETYELKPTQTRKVDSVFVKTGETVEAGAVLYTLEGDESVELSGAKKTLQAAQDAYNEALIKGGTGSSGISTAEKNLSKAERDLEKLVAKREKFIADNAVDLAAATAIINATPESSTAKETARKAEERVKELTRLLEDLGTKPVDPEPNLTRAQLYERVTLQEKAYQSANIVYNARLDVIGGNLAGASDAQLAALETARKELEAAHNELQTRQETYDKKTNYINNIQPYEKAEEDLKEQKRILEDAKAITEGKEVTEAQAVIDKYDADLDLQDAAIEKQEETVADAESAIDDAIDDAGSQVALDDFNMMKLRRAVTEAQTALADLQEDAETSEVTSPVSGIVKTISITPGNDATPVTAAMTIELPERGYYMTFSVTNAQAERLRPGIAAELTSWRWGGDMTITLATIRNDPDSPRDKKQLLLSVTGEDIESGTSLSVSMGSGGQNYDRVVSNSAIYSDADGDFVLLLTQKSSPLRTRYVATRIDVTVLAKDDVNSAVSGGLSNWDYIITASSGPITAGQYVRLSET
jgi:multidrug resistance efflux pump